MNRYYGARQERRQSCFRKQIARCDLLGRWLFWACLCSTRTNPCKSQVFCPTGNFGQQRRFACLHRGKWAEMKTLMLMSSTQHVHIAQRTNKKQSTIFMSMKRFSPPHLAALLGMRIARPLPCLSRTALSLNPQPLLRVSCLPQLFPMCRCIRYDIRKTSQAKGYHDQDGLYKHMTSMPERVGHSCVGIFSQP